MIRLSPDQRMAKFEVNGLKSEIIPKWRMAMTNARVHQNEKIVIGEWAYSKVDHSL